MNLQPINDNIVIKFRDEVKNGHFVDKQRSSGLIVDLGGDHQSSGMYNRIAEVVSVGPKVLKEVCTVGDNIVVEHLMWTESFQYESQKYWMTQPRCVLGKV